MTSLKPDYKGEIYSFHFEEPFPPQSSFSLIIVRRSIKRFASQTESVLRREKFPILSEVVRQPRAPQRLPDQSLSVHIDQVYTQLWWETPDYIQPARFRPGKARCPFHCSSSTTLGRWPSLCCTCNGTTAPRGYSVRTPCRSVYATPSWLAGTDTCVLS